MSDERGEARQGDRTVHRGVHWYRDRRGNVSFYDRSTESWVRWTRGGDTPPLPPKWQLLGVPTKVTRPGWRSPWRLLPAALILVAVVIAVIQALLPSSSQAAKEAKAAAALQGRCLEKSGSGFSSKAVACTDPRAAVKVVRVLPSTPGSPTCPSGTRGTELAYPGVTHPHILCVVPAGPSG